MQASDSRYLRSQAEFCISLSRSTFDLTLAGRLRTLAEELRAKASQWEDEVDGFHAHAYKGNGTHAGKPSRS